MVESSKKQKGSSSTTAAASHRRHGTSGDPSAPVPPSLRSSTLFSLDDQRQRYDFQFCNRVILDPKYLDLEFFDEETFDCCS